MFSLHSLFLQSLVLPLVSLGTSSKFWRIYREFKKTPQQLYDPSPSQSLEKIKKLVQHAYAKVPFYRERMDRLGFMPNALTRLDDLRRLPPTTKGDVASNFPDRITSAEKMFEPWRYVSTSGTTGRLTVIQDFRKRDLSRASLLLALNAATGYHPGMRYLDIPPDICANVCGTSSTADKKIISFLWETLSKKRRLDKEDISILRGLVDRQVVHRQLQLVHFGPEGLKQKNNVLDDYLEQMKRYRPYQVRGLSAYLYVLAIHMLEQKRQPLDIPGGLMPMGSSMTACMREVIEKAFGCRVHETYGSAELGSIAAECGHQNGLHPFAGLFYIEVVRNGQPVPFGEIGKILITDLYNYAMPLIRYDIGDVAIVRQGPCPCGLNSSRLEIQGRIQDCLRGKDGTILTSDRIMDEVLRAFPEVMAFQLEAQSGDYYYLQILPRGQTSPDADAIIDFLSKRLSGEPRIDARVVSTILPEPGGKFRFVKNRTDIMAEMF